MTLEHSVTHCTYYLAFSLSFSCTKLGSASETERASSTLSLSSDCSEQVREALAPPPLSLSVFASYHVVEVRLGFHSLGNEWSRSALDCLRCVRTYLYSVLLAGVIECQMCVLPLIECWICLLLRWALVLCCVHWTTLTNNTLVVSLSSISHELLRAALLWYLATLQISCGLVKLIGAFHYNRCECIIVCVVSLSNEACLLYPLPLPSPSWARKRDLLPTILQCFPNYNQRN